MPNPSFSTPTLTNIDAPEVLCAVSTQTNLDYASEHGPVLRFDWFRDYLAELARRVERQAQSTWTPKPCSNRDSN